MGEVECKLLERKLLKSGIYLEEAKRLASSALDKLITNTYQSLKEGKQLLKQE